MEKNLYFPNVNANEIIIREGQAPVLKEPVKLNFSGDIFSVSNFLKIREAQQENDLQEMNRTNAVVVVDKTKRSIHLYLDPANYYGAEIIGTLDFSDELKIFSINQNKTFSREEFVKLLRFNKIFFDDYEKHESLLKQIMAFNAKAYIELTAASDNRSNRNSGFTKSVDTQLPTDFILNIPIFKGFQKERIRIEIAFDVTEGSVKFWLESVELNEKVQSSIDAIINEELKSCAGLVIINK
jgi:hypothetical protein